MSILIATVLVTALAGLATAWTLLRPKDPIRRPSLLPAPVPVRAGRPRAAPPARRLGR